MRTRIAVLLTGLIAWSIVGAAPAQAALDGITITRVATTVTVEIDCSKNFATPWPTVKLSQGDTLTLASKYAKGVTGECESFYADGSLRPGGTPFALTAYFDPAFSLDSTVPFDADAGASYTVKADAPNVASGGIWAVLFGNSTGQHFNIVIAPPVPVVTGVASPVAGGTVTATDANSDGVWNLVATPASGYAFTSWSCTASQTPAGITNATTTVTLSANSTCTATFDAWSASASSPVVEKDGADVTFSSNAGTNKMTALFVDGTFVSDSNMLELYMGQRTFTWCYFDGIGDVTKDRTATYRVYDTTDQSFVPTFASEPLLEQEVTLIGNEFGCAPLKANLTGVLTDATQGSAYNVDISNPEAPSYAECYSLTVAEPGLPAGLEVSTEGVISGTPSATGTFTFTLSCEWGEGSVYVKEYTIEVKGASSTVARPVLMPDAAPVINTAASGANTTLSCVAPSFTPAANSVQYVWSREGVEVGRTAQLTVAQGPTATQYTCMVTGFVNGGGHSITNTITLAAAANPAAPPKVVEKTSTFSVRFGIKSSAVQLTDLVRLKKFVAGLGNVKSVTITGFVQATRVTSNDRQLSLARANRVATAFRSSGVTGEYKIIAGGRSGLLNANGRVVNVTVVWTVK